MIENFLRAPRSPAEYAADILRGLGVLGVVLAAVFFEPTDAGILAFALPGLFAPRFLGFPAAADLAVSVILLIAAWSNVFDLYTRIPNWDLLVHFFCTAVLAAGLYVVLLRSQVVADPRASPLAATVGVLLTATLGLALSAVWEMVEWLGFIFITPDISVTYTDTIGDMAAGGIGSVAVGVVVVLHLRSDRAARRGRSVSDAPPRLTSRPQDGDSWTPTS
ncbi:DUF2238 domain-containing protein [Nesterenkonia sp. E16_7]|uniref:DUF2238 domain-containing protein n=1 Tax=unclassified Nesterenkonia TaxID=2629769 RepID=UPI001A93156B|nr:MULTISPECIES: DUF2238 domain-containing protein [unclassified Nesterenkonia]MBO0594829.1 DUF2238 domain-containing protein [Nesterenkonia sp. E16_10]MBO0597078.1 DUF2238 domain-containing protein [Nesterenkonia sp. E16_7]